MYGKPFQETLPWWGLRAASSFRHEYSPPTKRGSDMQTVKEMWKTDTDGVDQIHCTLFVLPT